MSIKQLHKSERGLMTQLKAADYHSRTELNPSSIASGLRGPGNVDVRAIHAALHGDKQSRAQATQDRMDRGTLVHMALLQPERLATDVAIWTGKTRKGAEWDAFEHDAGDRLVMRQQDFDASMSVANELKNHSMVSGSISGTKAEVALFCSDQGFECRGQVDCIDIPGRRIVDVKTTDAGISPDQVERTIRSFHYREKMAMYRRWAAQITGTDPTEWKCWNLFLCMAEPFGITRVRFTDDALAWGEQQMLNAMQEYRSALKIGGELPIFALDHFVDVKPWETNQMEEVDDE